MKTKPPAIFSICFTVIRIFSTSSSAFSSNIAFTAARRRVAARHMTTCEAPPKFHHFTVCLVPSEREERVWEVLTRARTELQDAGLYRWPPHVNLLYPFCDPYDSNKKETNALDSDILQRLEAACRQVEPFQVQLNQFGTFGGESRGVLWLYPSSTPPPIVDTDNNASEESVLRLQRLLEEQFPHCNDQRLVGEEGGFKPHMTLSHFASRSEAQAAQQQLTLWWPSDNHHLQFWVDEIYLMHRRGETGGGQFERIASLPLGNKGTTQFMQGPFRQMPHEEYEWVKEARKIMKQRRNRRSRRGGPR